MRISVSHWATTEQDVARSADAIIACAAAAGARRIARASTPPGA